MKIATRLAEGISTGFSYEIPLASERYYRLARF